jgi:hypothetical protein
MIGGFHETYNTFEQDAETTVADCDCCGIRRRLRRTGID